MLLSVLCFQDGSLDNDTNSVSHKISMWLAGGCVQIMNVPQSSILQMFLLRNQSVDWGGHLLLEELCCLLNPAMSSGREGCLARGALLTWSQSEHVWAPELTASSTASSSSLHPSTPGALGQTLFSYRAASVWWSCGEGAQEAALCCSPRILEMAGHLVVTWSNSLEIVIT